MTRIVTTTYRYKRPPRKRKAVARKARPGNDNRPAKWKQASSCPRNARWFEFSFGVRIRKSSGSNHTERVMPRGSDPAPPRTETPAGLREMAARARRLAQGMLDEQTITRLTEFAQELEARAAALEPAAQTFTHSDAVAVQRSDPDVGQS